MSDQSLSSRRSRSFDLVDLKLAEADFFLDCLKAAGPELFPLNFYFSAFLSASRSVTFTLQAVMDDVEGFDNWYSDIQEELRSDPICVAFRDLRNVALKVGESPVKGGRMKVADGDRQWSVLLNPKLVEELGIPADDERDALVLSEQFLQRLVQVIWECYEHFGCYIDAKERLTQDCLERLGMTVEAAEAELGFPPGWTDGVPRGERLRMLRGAQPGCRIDELFEKYLGMRRH